MNPNQKNLLSLTNFSYDPTKVLEKTIDTTRDLFLSGVIDSRMSLYICAALKVITSWQQEETQERVNSLSAIVKQEDMEQVQYMIPSTAIYINSSGGYLGASTAIINAIHETPYHVISVAAGDVFSAAAYVYASADLRLASPLAMFMLHEPSYMQQGELSKHKGRWEAIERQQDRWLSYFASRTNKPVEFWKDKLNDEHDYYMTADEALELGLVDEIIDYNDTKLGLDKKDNDGKSK